MRAASSWCPACGPRGPRGGRRPIWWWPAPGPRSRRSRPSVSRPWGSGWPSTCGSIPGRTFEPRRWFASCDTCFGISEAPSVSCGTEVGPTGLGSSSACCSATPESIRLSSPAMLPSSTRTSSSGPTSNETWPIAFPGIWSSSGGSWKSLCEGSATPSTSYGRVFGHPICHGDMCIHYLVKDQ